MARHRHYGHHAPLGILGTYASDPKVVGVFPELSATIIPHAQEIRLHRGDDLELDFQLQNDRDPPDPVQVGGGVIRWAAKQGYGVGDRPGISIGNEGALITKRSSEPQEISLAGTGRGTVHIRREDTLGLPLSPAIWDLEVTKPGLAVQLPDAAQAHLLDNYDVVTASGFVWPDGIMVGDIFEAQGRCVLITKIISQVHLKLDWKSWLSGMLTPGSFSIRRGVTKTVASGPFVVQGDVIV